MNIGYVRVSSEKLNEAKQKDALANYDIQEWFVEIPLQEDLRRPKLQELLRFAKKGDTIFVYDLTRLSRSMMDLLGLLKQLENENITLAIHKENTNTAIPFSDTISTLNSLIKNYGCEVNWKAKERDHNKK